MNISEFIMTVTASLLAGVGIGLTIKSIWYFIVRIAAKIIRRQKTVKTVDFSYFFSNCDEEIK